MNRLRAVLGLDPSDNGTRFGDPWLRRHLEALTKDTVEILPQLLLGEAFLVPRILPFADEVLPGQLPEDVAYEARRFIRAVHDSLPDGPKPNRSAWIDWMI